MKAILWGNEEITKALLPLEAGIQSKSGRTALMFAVLRNRTTEVIVTSLAEKEINMRD